MTFFEKPKLVEPWRPELPPSVQRAFSGERFRCGKCGTRDDLGTNERDAVFCATCWGAGGCGFAWWRL